MTGLRFRTVRVFISSTFLDMQAERDHLVRFVFPKLREELLRRCMHLVEVDLRWGVTGEQDAVTVCREVIDECRPRFVCILGGRYGWVPPGESRSITADEVHYAVLDRSGAERGLAYFYFRAVDVTESVSERHYGEFREPADSAAAMALAELKTSIIKAGFEPHTYRAKWDSKAKRLTDLDDFGQRVYRDILQSIQTEFGEEEVEEAGEFDEEDAAVEAFVDQRLTNFVLGSRKDVKAAILAHALQAEQPGFLCITGESGSGKSTLLAHIVRSMNEQPERPSKLVYHFVGAGARSADIDPTLNRLCHHLGVPNDPGSERRITDVFAEALAKAQGSRRTVIVIDGINQLTSAYGPWSWLPRKLPDHVCVIFSTVSREAVAEMEEWPTPVSEIVLTRLRSGDKIEIINGFLARYGKVMDEIQQGSLAAKRDADVPLYLVTALEELRTLGTSEEITARINELPRETSGLIKWLFKRLECDDGFRDASGAKIGELLTKSVLSLICASRRGLSEHDIRELLVYVPRGTNLPNRSPLAWLQILLSGANKPMLRENQSGNVAAILMLLRPHLIRRGELVSFNHDQIRLAVIGSYMSHGSHVHATHRRLGLYFMDRWRSGDTSEAMRAGQEMMYHLYLAGMWNEIVSIFSDTTQFERLPAKAYGVNYQAGVFDVVDEDCLRPEALKRLPKNQQHRGAISLANAFADRARQNILRASDFQKPWPLTAHRLRNTDHEAFAKFRDTFYGFMHLAHNAFEYAAVAYEGKPHFANGFLQKWGDVAYCAGLFWRYGSERTGLSGQLNDLVTLRGLRKLEAWSKRHSYEDKASQKVRRILNVEHLLYDAKPADLNSSEVNGSDTVTEDWIAQATPTLEEVRALFGTMKWSESEPAPEGSDFEACLITLVNKLPRLPEQADRRRLEKILEGYFNRKIYYGLPIPDSYYFTTVFPDRESMWLDQRPIKSCSRIGLFVSKETLEGYGRLTEGVLIEPTLNYL